MTRPTMTRPTMTRPTMTRPTRHAMLARSLLLLAAAIGVTAVAMPLLRALELRDVVAAQRSTIATLTRTPRDNVPTLVNDMRAIVVAPSAARAGAKLQAMLDDHASRYGVQLRSTQILQTPLDRDRPSVAVELSIEADTAGTTRFVHALETGHPVLLIEELSQQLAKPIDDDAGPVLATALKIRAFVNLREEP
jgi:hypothetical protein